MGAYAPCSECGAWQDTQHVSPPSAGTARMPLVSIGTPASRWLTIVTSATTSAPSHGSESSPSGNVVPKQMFDPTSSNSNGASGAIAAAAVMTEGSGS